MTRRRFLVISGMGIATGLILAETAGAQSTPSLHGTHIGNGVFILPRDVWGADLPPAAPMESEAPEDVRFMIVHHSATANNYSAAESTRLLRSFYHFHTSPEKGWPDLAYNFLVDRHGQIFEGRAGSIASPVKGDATGGSQGFALLCCFIGDHTEVAPTTAAQSAMIALLAWLANTYEIDPSPGATAEFVSRGSNLHPSGATVTTPTITGHRTMSRTTCPGDAAFALVEDSFPAQVNGALTGTASSSAAPETASATSVTTPETSLVASTTSPPVSTASSPEPATSSQESTPRTEPRTSAALVAPPEPTSVASAPVTASTSVRNREGSLSAPAATPTPSTTIVPRADRRTNGIDDAASSPTGPGSTAPDSNARLGLALVAAGATVAMLWPAVWLSRRAVAALRRHQQPVTAWATGRDLDAQWQGPDAERQDSGSQPGAGP